MNDYFKGIYDDFFGIEKENNNETIKEGRDRKSVV